MKNGDGHQLGWAEKELGKFMKYRYFECCWHEESIYPRVLKAYYTVCFQILVSLEQW